MARQKAPLIAIFLALPLLYSTPSGMVNAEAAKPFYMAKKGKSGSSHMAKKGKSGSPHVVHGQPQHGPPAHAPAHGYRKKHKYHYYPKSNVYYAPDRKLYFYSDGNGWKTNAKLPTSIRLNLGESTSLEIDSDLPYKTFSKD
jgi:hypothetical protein